MLKEQTLAWAVGCVVHVTLKIAEDSVGEMTKWVSCYNRL